MEEDEFNFSLPHNPSYNVREFEWFEIETKIRKFVA